VYVEDAEGIALREVIGNGDLFAIEVKEGSESVVSGEITTVAPEDRPSERKGLKETDEGDPHEIETLLIPITMIKCDVYDPET